MFKFTVCMSKHGLSLCNNNFSYILYHQSKKFLNIHSRCRALKVENDPYFKTKPKEKLLSVDDVVKNRFSEASRTILIQSKDSHSVDNIMNMCQEFGDIDNICEYQSHPDSKTIFLVEYKHQSSLKHARQCVPFPSYMGKLSSSDYAQMLNLRSHSMIYDISGLTANKSSKKNKVTRIQQPEINLQTCKNIDDQFLEIYEKSKISEISLKLRFFICHQIAQALTGIYPDIEVIPFGSTINSFGTNESDLDAAIHLTKDAKVNISKKSNGGGLLQNIKGSPLFQYSDTKIANKLILNSIGDIIRIHVPHCLNVNKILRARVPIIKFDHEATGLACDLSLQSRGGLYMSELLHIYGNADSRVAKLVFAIRYWCKKIDLNPFQDTQRISNFAITLMVLFYLMKIKNPVVLPVSRLIKMKRPEDERRLPEGIDCSFLRDPNLVPRSQNDQSISTLLHGFFKFYSEFNFKTDGICLRTGNVVLKNDYTKSNVLYIVNPQNPQLNVTANVTTAHVENFKIQVKEAMLRTETFSHTDLDHSWGLMKLFSFKPSRNKKNLSVKSYFEN